MYVYIIYIRIYILKKELVLLFKKKKTADSCEIPNVHTIHSFVSKPHHR